LGVVARGWAARGGQSRRDAEGWAAARAHA